VAADRLNLIRVMPAQGGVLTSSQQHRWNLVVVGGGVVGLSVAWEACRHGLRPLVLERDEPGSGATHVAAGMLAPVSEAAFGERSLLELNLASARAYPDWVARLREDSDGIDPGYLRCGSLLVARDRDQAEVLERELAFRVQEGLAVRRLLPSEARRREPALAPTLRLAVEAIDDHAVDPRLLTSALCSAIEHGGGEVRRTAGVDELLSQDDRVTGVRLESGESVACADVVLAAGCWSGRIAGLPPAARPPLRPVKGQLLRLRDASGPGLLRSAVRSEDVYLVPRGDGRYIVGATVEERGFDTSVTAGAAFDLLRQAVDVVPGIAELEIEALLAGLRPGTPDNAPIIGPGALEGLHWATGHYRNGVLLAPITASLVVSHLLDEAVPEIGAPFAPARFAAEVAA
jgi:glycine oxidase